MSALTGLVKRWMGSLPDSNLADWIMVGLPFDGTTSFRPGTRFAPEAVRAASYGVETYSPLFDRDLEDDCRFFDAGELEFPFGNTQAVLDIIRQAAQRVYQQNKRWFGIGGEHLVTYPVIQACLEKYPDLVVLQFDAHADLRDDYLGEKFSHATVMRRILDHIEPERFAQVGIRSGPRDEWGWMRTHGTLKDTPAELTAWLDRYHGKPLFLTVDLDVLDPSIMSGTGTPEPGGLSYRELLDWLLLVKDRHLVGADILELSPSWDPSGVSTVVAARLVRDMLLLTLNQTDPKFQS